MTVDWKFTKKQTVLIAPEGATYGTPPALNNVNYKGLLVSTPKITPVAEKLTRDFLRDSFTKVAPGVGRKSIEITMTTELKGCGLPAAPETSTQVVDMLKACGMTPGSWDWSDGTDCADVYWIELAAGDNCHVVAPYDSVWLVEDSAGVPVNRKAVVLSVVRRKESDADAVYYDCVIVALADDTGLDLTATQELQADNAGAPAGVSLADARVSAGNAVMNKGLALRPTSTYSVYHAQSVAVAYFLDGILHVMPGGLGSFDIKFEDGKTPMLNCKLYGLWSDPTTTAVPTGCDFLSHQPPSVCKQDLTMATNSGSGLTSVYKPNFSSFGFDMANTVNPDKNLNAVSCAGEFFITDRTPTAGIDPAVDALANFNPWATWSAGATRVLTLCIGYTEIGNRVAICLPQAAHDTLAYGDRDGRATYDMKINPVGDIDDEVVIIFG